MRCLGKSKHKQVLNKPRPLDPAPGSSPGSGPWILPLDPAQDLALDPALDPAPGSGPWIWPLDLPLDPPH